MRHILLLSIFSLFLCFKTFCLDSKSSSIKTEEFITELKYKDSLQNVEIDSLKTTIKNYELKESFYSN